MGALAKPEPKRTVLVIDDGADNRLLLKALLERGGYRPLLAEDGAAGLAVLEGETPALILLDYMMPGLAGPDVARRIRGLPACGNTPIILLTASADEGHIEQAFEAGADDYVTKPFDRRILMARVASAIRGADDRRGAQLTTQAVAARDRMVTDLEEAARVQRGQMSTLPRRFFGGIAMGAVVPCGHVGGDLLQVFENATGTQTAVVLDVSGHGTAAALVASNVLAELRGSVRNLSLAASFAMLNEINAGLPPVLHVREGVVIGRVEASGPPPGLIADVIYEPTRLELEGGDRLIVVSDGLTEPFGNAADLGPCLAGLDLLAPGALATAALSARIRRMFGGRDLADDATVLVLDCDM